MNNKYKTSHLPVDQIDKLRFQAFKTNSPADMDAYYRATSSYFQDHIIRAMNREVKDARIAELQSALRSILQIPNSDAARGIMKVFAEDALGEKT
jgi:hypothetical protein